MTSKPRSTWATVLMIATLALSSAGCASCTTGGPVASSTRSGGQVSIVMWHGYTGAEATTLATLVTKFNSTHPDVHVTAENYGNSDYALQKVLTAIAGGKYPDISYLYGSWAANIAKSPKVVALNSLINADPSFDLKDFYPSEVKAMTVGSKVIGVTALVDNLALVYNKTLFDNAGLSYPTRDWTWSDMRAAAKALTNTAKKQFGFAYVADGGEDTVWRFEDMLWQAGGQILTADQQHAAFNSDAGVRALTLLQQMTIQDHSVYLDPGDTSYAGLFNTNHIGMLWTGPWDLSNINGVPFGVQILPGDVNHQTISGPDNWVMFDNGSAHVQASWEFLKWFTASAQVMAFSLGSGDLPTRRSATALPDYSSFTGTYPGVSVWVDNLANAVNSRPVLATYPKISNSIGQAVASVLLGKAQPAAALNAAADEVNAVLAAP
jgi:multiple sugar transport system substrate-binding protein